MVTTCISLSPIVYVLIDAGTSLCSRWPFLTSFIHRQLFWASFHLHLCCEFQFIFFQGGGGGGQGGNSPSENDLVPRAHLQLHNYVFLQKPFCKICKLLYMKNLSFPPPCSFVVPTLLQSIKEYPWLAFFSLCGEQQFEEKEGIWRQLLIQLKKEPKITIENALKVYFIHCYIQF